jgi:hypothetical protein
VEERSETDLYIYIYMYIYMTDVSSLKVTRRRAKHVGVEVLIF